MNIQNATQWNSETPFSELLQRTRVDFDLGLEFLSTANSVCVLGVCPLTPISVSFPLLPLSFSFLDLCESLWLNLISDSESASPIRRSVAVSTVAVCTNCTETRWTLQELLLCSLLTPELPPGHMAPLCVLDNCTFLWISNGKFAQSFCGSLNFIFKTTPLEAEIVWNWNGLKLKWFRRLEHFVAKKEWDSSDSEQFTVARGEASF